MARMMRRGCAVALISLTGCAHQHAVQNVANLTAARTDDLKTQMVAFVESANMMRTEGAQRMSILQEWTTAIAIDTAASLQTWKATSDDESKTARDIFDAITAFGRSDALPIAAPPLFGDTTPTVAKIKFDPTQYETLVKQLTALGAPKSLRDEVKFLVGFGSAVDTSYSADVAKAKNTVSTTMTAGKTAANNVPKPPIPSAPAAK